MIKSVGVQLRRAREERELTLSQVARATHIRTHYLQALEEGDFSRMASHVQVRGFLRSYADFLGLNAEEILDALRQTQTPAPPPEPDEAAEIPPDVLQAEKQADEIFAALGKKLNERRDLLGLSHEDVEQHIHIPVHYIKRLEEGEFGSFPSPAQARGMLGNFANFLELDANEVLLQYAEGIQARFTARRAQQEKIEKPQARPALRMPYWLRNMLSADVIFGTALIVSLMAFFIWGIGRIVTTQAGQEPQPTAPSLADVLLPTSTPQPTLSPTTELQDLGEILEEAEAAETLEADGEEIGGEEIVEQASPQPVLPPVGSSGLQLTIIMRQRAWLRVTVDGQVQFEGRAAPGETLNYSGTQQIELLTGNAAALQIIYNQEDLGPLGVFGEVRSVVFTAGGILVPTPAEPTAQPTITPTPVLTATPIDALP
jgi:cytoskeletal protein RodZ